nr:LPS export ABC transporter periplasmic protein LptC [Candidatus Enterousia merdequi]
IKIRNMKQNHRNFIIISKHRRLTRIWQFFFTGWGLTMIAILIAASLFTKQILWTPIQAINMHDIVTNQFKMTNAQFVGTDKDGNPFKIKAKSGYQEYGNTDIIFLEKPSGSVVRLTDKGKVTDKISATKGQFNSKEKVLTLYKNVRIDSSNGDKILTNEMVIKL